jgi:DNA-binding transcriptional ArsR family regulator
MASRERAENASAPAETSARYGQAMQGDADIAAVAGVIGDRSRSRVLLALGDGRALAASVLAQEAGVAASTISEHLAKLVDAGLLSVESHGRHRYYRLAGPQVARLLESLAQHAPAAPVTSLRQGTRANAIRAGRYCYDHLGGRLGVSLMQALLERGILAGGDGRFRPGPGRPGLSRSGASRPGRDRLSAPGADVDYQLTAAGEAWARGFGIDIDAVRSRRRPMVRYCVDWSEQQHHLAGALGAAIADQLLTRGWIERAPTGRAVRVTEAGDAALPELFGFELERTAA